MAVNRAVMDQANTILLRQKLEDAKAAAARGDLPGAAKLYEDAMALVNQIGSGIDAETAQTISGLVDTRLELARQAQHNGDYLAADAAGHPRLDGWIRTIPPPSNSNRKTTRSWRP